jgi:hypothetical protein
MKVVLCRTSDTDKDLFVKTVDILKAVNGFPILALDSIEINIGDKNSVLAFDDFFRRCQSIRDVFANQIGNEDIVILLTGIKNFENWFSAYQLPLSNRNVFIQISEWNQYDISEEKTQYVIAHQIVENCIQILMDLNYENEENSIYIHLNSKGCLNDFCLDKRGINYKLRIADICKECLNKIRSIDEASEFARYAWYIMNIVRNEIVNFKPDFKIKYESNFEVKIESGKYHLKIDSRSTSINIFSENNYLYAVKLKPLEFALYRCIFEFSVNVNRRGLKLSYLEDEQSLEYRFFSKLYSGESVRKSKYDPIKNFGVTPYKTFNEYKSKINKKIENDFVKYFAINSSDFLDSIMIKKLPHGFQKICYAGDISLIN